MMADYQMFSLDYQMFSLRHDKYTFKFRYKAVCCTMERGKDQGRGNYDDDSWKWSFIVRIGF